MKLSEIYASSSYEIRLKAPVLQATILILLIAAIPAMLNSFIRGQLPAFAVFLILLIIMLINLVILRRGGYNRAALFSVFAIAVLLSLTQQLNAYVGEHTIGSAGLVSILIIFFSTLFSPRRTHLLAADAIAALNLVLMIARPVVGGTYTEQTSSIIQQIITPILVTLIVSGLSILLKNIFDKVLSDATEKLEISERQASKLSALAAEATEKLQVAQSMEDQARETSVSVSEITGNVEGISSQVESLAAGYRRSISSLDQIAARSQDLDKVAEDQSANIIQTGAALEQMVASVKNVSQVIIQKMSTVRELQDAAREGDKTIRDTTTSFSQVLQYLEGVKNLIGRISDIADRTNLLAMNAAIQAAHAGDAGRGFAVVAGEVRTLAESSSANADQVSQTIAQLVKAIEQTGINVEGSGRSFQIISTEVKDVGDAMEEINSSVKEIAVGSDEILTATSSMTELTTRVSDAVRTVRENEETVHRDVVSLGDFVQSLNGSMEHIRQGGGVISGAARELIEKSNAINLFVKDFSRRLAE